MFRKSYLRKKYLQKDLTAGLVVFLVAIPLCLGIALASNVPLFSGIIAGVIGGLIVGAFSGSQLSVSGPAAGLVAIVLSAQDTLQGNLELFFCAVLLSGLFQLTLGYLRAGAIGDYIPSNVIEGMLAGIGIIITLKQIPHALGFDKDYEGNLDFASADGENTFSMLAIAWESLSPGSTLVALISLAILLLWNKVDFLKNLTFLPPQLAVVLFGIAYTLYTKEHLPEYAISQEHLVQLPVTNSFSDFLSNFSFPDFSGLWNKDVWVIALTIAVVASIETLLSIEAVDRLDPKKRWSDPNQELKAQGIGNIASGLLGGLPVTSVIVRSSANVNSGGITKVATLTHGALLLLCVTFIPGVLNCIPYASLAAILILIGYKLANPSLLKKWYQEGWYQFIPFATTAFAVVTTDLLTGVTLGLAVSIFFLLKENLKVSVYCNREEEENNKRHFIFAQEVSFLNKAAIRRELDSLPRDGTVILDAHNTAYIDRDVQEIIREFVEVKAPEKNIQVELIGFDHIFGTKSKNG